MNIKETITSGEFRHPTKNTGSGPGGVLVSSMRAIDPHRWPEQDKKTQLVQGKVVDTVGGLELTASGKVPGASGLLKSGGLELTVDYNHVDGKCHSESELTPTFEISAQTADIVRREINKLVVDKVASPDEPLQLGYENDKGWPRVTRLTHRCHGVIIAINAAFRSSINRAVFQPEFHDGLHRLHGSLAAQRDSEESNRRFDHHRDP